jgi:soluble lytic murein transglycosylase
LARCGSFVLACLAAAGTLPVVGQIGAAPASVREAFVEAYRAAQLGRTSAAGDSSALRDYVLYPYVLAARLRHALEREAGDAALVDDETAAFLATHEGEAVALPVRRAWLESLARRGRWRVFLEQYDANAATESLECLRLQARIALEEGEAVRAAIAARWLTPRQLPGECEPAFRWLRERGELGDALVAARVRALLESGQASFARTIARRLPDAEAAPLRQWADLIDKPAGAIDALLEHPETEVADAALQDGFARLARAAPEAALERFDALRASRLSNRESASKAARALALGLAWDRNPRALDLFGLVAPADMSDDAFEWLVRAALWKGDFSLAADGIAAMSPGRRDESAWRYWEGRAAEAVGEEARASERYASLAGQDNYYSGMAAARLGTRVEPRVERLPADETAIARIAAEPPFVRSRELALAGLRTLATVEWHAGYARLDASLGPQAIHLAERLGFYDIAVATATGQGVFNDYALLYPRPYADEVEAAVDLTSLDRALLYGILRQESLFRPDATSLAGAMGLAQLTPGTAAVAARRWQLPQPQRADLYDPATNIRLGAAHLTTLLEKFGGALPVALAAYNAGDAAASRWLPAQPLDSDVWIENIPYNETRAYVRRVLWHSLVFSWLSDGSPKDTRAWLGTVAPLE